MCILLGEREARARLYNRVGGAAIERCSTLERSNSSVLLRNYRLTYIEKNLARAPQTFMPCPKSITKIAK
jgi:hypothetical protein